MKDHRYGYMNTLKAWEKESFTIAIAEIIPCPDDVQFNNKLHIKPQVCLQELSLLPIFNCTSVLFFTNLKPTNVFF